MLISISKSLVFGEVQKLAAYAGAKYADAMSASGAYARLGIQDEDREVLESAWQEFLPDVARLLAPYAKSASLPPQPHGTDLAVDFSLPVAFPDSLPAAHVAALSTALVRYGVRRLLAAWLAVASPELAARFAAYAETARDNIRRLLIGKVRR